MNELEKHRKTWQGKSDEWLFERIALELKHKVETIHNLLAENEQLRIANVSDMVCDCKERREIFEKFECVNCGKLHIDKC